VAGGGEQKSDVPDESESEQLGCEVRHERALRFLRASSVEVAATVCKGAAWRMLAGPEDASGMPRPGRGKRHAHLKVGKLGGPPTPPHPMHECQKKGDRKWAICKSMKRKSDVISEDGRRIGGEKWDS
jgi:hypothetical protein